VDCNSVSIAQIWIAVLLDKEIPNAFPETDYSYFFRPAYQLHFVPDKMRNMNSPEYLENVKML
jgi:hypothetical protein